MKMKRWLTFILSLAMIFAMLPFASIPVKAASDEGGSALHEARSGVLTIQAGFKENGSKTVGLVSLGSGFLIGSVDTGQYVITCDHVVDIENYREDYAKKYKLNAKNLKTVVQVVGTTSNIKWPAKVIKQSPDQDFAILELEDKLYDCHSFTLSDDSYVAESIDVYAMGFPFEMTQFGQDFSKNKDDDVAITKGIVNKFATIHGIDCIVHDAKVEQGNSGGPLVDADGNVYGVNAYLVDGYGYSVKINIVKEALRRMGVEFDEVGKTPAAAPSPDSDPVESTTAAASANKSGLEDVIKEAEELQEKDYDKESFSNLQEKLEDAKKVNDNPDASQAEVDEAKANLSRAMDSDTLKKKSGFPIIIVIIAVAVVLLAILLIILLSSRSKKKKKAAMNSSAGGYPGSEPRPAPMPTPAPMPAPAPAPRPAPMPTPGPAYFGEGAGETSVLNEGAGETTILSGSGSIQATLFRESNSENIRINKSVFSIGKERMKVDYCISDNNSVSRNHAEIIIKGGKFYIVDQRSKNGTFVNDVRIDPLQEVEIKSGDKLRLSDEEFVFRAI